MYDAISTAFKSVSSAVSSTVASHPYLTIASLSLLCGAGVIGAVGVRKLLDQRRAEAALSQYLSYWHSDALARDTRLNNSCGTCGSCTDEELEKVVHQARETNEIDMTRMSTIYDREMTEEDREEAIRDAISSTLRHSTPSKQNVFELGKLCQYADADPSHLIRKVSALYSRPETEDSTSEAEHGSYSPEARILRAALETDCGKMGIAVAKEHKERWAAQDKADWSLSSTWHPSKLRSWNLETGGTGCDADWVVSKKAQSDAIKTFHRLEQAAKKEKSLNEFRSKTTGIEAPADKSAVTAFRSFQSGLLATVSSLMSFQPEPDASGLYRMGAFWPLIDIDMMRRIESEAPSKDLSILRILRAAHETEPGSQGLVATDKKLREMDKGIDQARLAETGAFQKETD